MVKPVDSPCVGVCVIDARTDTCHGCFRTPREIGGWPRASEEERRAILVKLKARRREAGLPDLPDKDEVGEE